MSVKSAPRFERGQRDRLQVALKIMTKDQKNETSPFDLKDKHCLG